MTDTEKIAAIEALLHDLVALTSHLSSTPRSRWPGPEGDLEIAAAESATLHEVAAVVGIKLH